MSVGPGWGHKRVRVGCLRTGSPGNPPPSSCKQFYFDVLESISKPPPELSAVDTAVTNQVQVLPLNGLLWSSGYLFLRMESIWFYDEWLLLILMITVWLY